MQVEGIFIGTISGAFLQFVDNRILRNASATFHRFIMDDFYSRPPNSYHKLLWGWFEFRKSFGGSFFIQSQSISSTISPKNLLFITSSMLFKK
uniref:Uncharacterized protein n=1 Tax=Strongyloides venezuelensis TaxID=75913 RepID=A0A0K0FPZ3_STRVS